MSVYYPQAAMTLRVVWEDFGQNNIAKLQQIYSLPIVARRVTVNINDYTQADTFSAEIDYKQFPFDPRTIRACGVTISMQDMKKVFAANNTNEQIKPTTENTVFIGFADDEGIDFDEDKRTVKLEGRDFTSLLIDRKYIGGVLDLGQPLDVILANLLLDLKETQELKVSNRVFNTQGQLETLPTIAQFAPDFNELGTQKNPKRDENYWDVIQDLVNRAGLIAYIELDKLVLTRPRTLYDRKAAKRMIYGKNVKRLEFKRKIGRKKNFNIYVRSLNVETKQVITAAIPEEATPEWSKETGIPNLRVKLPNTKSDQFQDPKNQKNNEPEDAPFISFRVPNIASKTQLVSIGERIYEEIGRQQLEGQLTTHELDVIDSNKACFNVLKWRNGTPIQIELDQGDLEGLNKLKSVGEKARFLRQRCWEPTVADILAETLGKFEMIFYTKAIEFTIDSEQGFTAKIDFINFIELGKFINGKAS